MRLSPEIITRNDEAAESYASALAGSPGEAYLLGRGFSLEQALRAGLGYVGEPATTHENYRRMLSISYRTRAGVVAFKFRRWDDNTPKYLAPLGQQVRLFNVNALLETGDTIAIAEGEIDALTLSVLCGIPAVGVPGVQSWRKHFPRLFEGYEKVWIFADQDQKEDSDANPGMELARRIVEDVPQAQVITLPAGEDVNRTYLNQGREALRGMIGLEE